MECREFLSILTVHIQRYKVIAVKEIGVKENMKRGNFPVVLSAVLLAAALLCGCGRKQDVIRSLEDMKDRSLTIALSDDIDAKTSILEICPKARFMSQNDVLFGIRSVSEGASDAYVCGRLYAEQAIRNGNVQNVRILEEPLLSYRCGLGLSELCGIPNYESAVNETLTRLITDGTLDEMRDRWFKRGCDQIPEIKLDEDPEYTLKAVTFGESRPYSFVANGELTGFDVELAYRICAENHWGIELSHAQYPGMLMGLTTGRFDMVSANLYITENRGENILFSVPYRSEEITVTVRDDTGLTAGSTSKIPEYGDLAGLQEAKSFGVLLGSIFDEVVEEYYPQAEVKYYQELSDIALALTSGKIDAALYDVPTLRHLSADNDGVALLPEYLNTEDYHILLAKSDRGERLNKEFNEWLGEQKQSGELQRMSDFWCGSEEPSGILNFEELPDVNGCIGLAVSVAGRPDTFLYNNTLSGHTMEIMYNFCRDRGYAAEISLLSNAAVIPSLLSGKSDFGIGLYSYTEERAQSVLFTDSIMEGGIGALVRTVSNEKQSGLSETFRTGLKKTFVTEDRWKLIVSGLGITCLIMLGSFVLANILGTLFCSFMMSGRKGLLFLADVYDRIVQGTPTVVILMILYYVVFGKSSISGVWVAILGFGITSGASLARQFYGAVTGVDRGQTEASLAIGFTKLETFVGIIFPQAARSALPGYFSELISLMKGTAVVGYIAVTDVTKAGDLIRSSTYDAFFPLLSVALLYFLIAFLILSLLKVCQKKLAPKRVSVREAEK